MTTSGCGWLRCVCPPASAPPTRTSSPCCFELHALSCPTVAQPPLPVLPSQGLCMGLWLYYFLNELAEMMEPWSAADAWEEENERRRQHAKLLRRKGQTVQVPSSSVRTPHNSVRGRAWPDAVACSLCDAWCNMWHARLVVAALPPMHARVSVLLQSVLLPLVLHRTRPPAQARRQGAGDGRGGVVGYQGGGAAYPLPLLPSPRQQGCAGVHLLLLLP